MCIRDSHPGPSSSAHPELPCRPTPHVSPDSLLVHRGVKYPGLPAVTHPVLVLQHAPWERPGLISQALAEGAPGVPGLTRTVAAEPRPNLLAEAVDAAVPVLG